MIKARKRVETVVSLDMDRKSAEQLDKWLLWAFVVWQQIQYHPVLQGEIFHGQEGSDLAPPTTELNHDTNLLLRLRLKSPEFEEI